MVSAEYGGTGGKPLEGGMVVEEPDIEIGQGVSSKGLLSKLTYSPFPHHPRHGTPYSESTTTAFPPKSF